MYKKIIITGGTSGIGYALYKAFKNDDNQIVIFSRRSSRKKDLFDSKTLLLDVNISSYQEVEQAGKKALEYLGSVDLLINNAGISFPGRFADTSVKEINESISVNLLGHLYVTRFFLPELIRQKGSMIINITSAAAETGVPGLAVYSAAKHGFKGFTDALRKEIAEQDVRVVEISPGGVATPIHDTLIRKKGRNSVNMENALDPEDVASAVLFAVSQPENTSINEIQLRHASLKMVGSYL